MKVQWCLKNVENEKEFVIIGEEFEIVDDLKDYFKENERLSKIAGKFLFGHIDALHNPIGLLTLKEIKKNIV